MERLTRLDLRRLVGMETSSDDSAVRYCHEQDHCAGIGRERVPRRSVGVAVWRGRHWSWACRQPRGRSDIVHRIGGKGSSCEHGGGRPIQAVFA